MHTIEVPVGSSSPPRPRRFAVLVQFGVLPPGPIFSELSVGVREINQA
jgi:hypothetical protein